MLRPCSLSAPPGAVSGQSLPCVVLLGVSWEELGMPSGNEWDRYLDPIQAVGPREGTQEMNGK